MTKYLFKHAYLVHENVMTHLLFDGKAISYLDHVPEDFDGKIIDLDGKIVIRGFADPHMHLDKALIAEKVENKSGTLHEAIKIMQAYKKQMTDEDLYARMDKVIQMAYLNGSRFLRTHLDIDENIKLRTVKILNELKQKYPHMYIEGVAFPQEGILSQPHNLTLLEDCLKAGIKILGGIPAMDKDANLHIEKLFDLAEKYQADLDFHMDETDDPNTLTIVKLIEEKMQRKYQRTVTADHLCSLASVEKEQRKVIIQNLKAAKIHVISLPSTNLYLQGRLDDKAVRRGITPIKEMIEKGVTVAIGSDNIRDPFNCFGNASMLEAALICAHGAHMGSRLDFKHLFEMISLNGLKIMGLDHRLKDQDSFVVVDARTEKEAIIHQVGIHSSFEKGRLIEFT